LVFKSKIALVDQVVQCVSIVNVALHINDKIKCKSHVYRDYEGTMMPKRGMASELDFIKFYFKLWPLFFTYKNLCNEVIY
jgi:hypothetical protein